MKRRGYQWPLHSSGLVLTTSALGDEAHRTARRLFNQALFETIAIDTEQIDGHELAPPFAQLATLNHHYEEHSANGRPGRGTKKRTPDPARVRGSDVPLLVVTLSL